MSAEMSDEANELLIEGQKALRPTAADKSRIAQALHAKLQLAEVPREPIVEAPPPIVDGTGSPWMAKVVALTGGVVASVAALLYVTRPAQPETPATDVVAQTATIPSEQAPAAEPPVEIHQLPSADAEQQVSAPSAASAASNNRGAPRAVPGDRLAEEAALLASAEKAFHAGNFNQTLTLIAQHRATFPKGVLARERVLLRVQTLCALGRYDEADEEQSRLNKFAGTTTTKACGRAP